VHWIDFLVLMFFNENYKTSRPCLPFRVQILPHYANGLTKTSCLKLPVEQMLWCHCLLSFIPMEVWPCKEPQRWEKAAWFRPMVTAHCASRAFVYMEITTWITAKSKKMVSIIVCYIFSNIKSLLKSDLKCITQSVHGEEIFSYAKSRNCLWKAGWGISCRR